MEVDRTSHSYLLGVAEYERDKYKAALERIARENPPHETLGHGLSDYGGNGDDMAADLALERCARIGDFAREVLDGLDHESELASEKAASPPNMEGVAT